MIMGAIPLTGLAGAGVASGDDKCTDQINYAGDSRSNAEINSIGASTGKCPTPMSRQNGLPGLVDGAVEGSTCYNTTRFRFGQTTTGAQLICVDQGSGVGSWASSLPTIGVRQAGAPCTSEQQFTAQSPSGQAMVCDTSTGWVPSAGG